MQPRWELPTLDERQQWVAAIIREHGNKDRRRSETKMKKNAILLIIICWHLVGCQSSDSLPTTGEYQLGMGRFDRTMLRLMKKWDMPGGSLAVMQDGEILLARGYGFANIETEELVQPDALFRIASISKPITAAAVLKLAEDGKLDLDMSAFQILDGFQLPEGAQIDPRFRDVTIRHLLEHAGGWDQSVSLDPMFKTREIAEELGTSPPADCPAIIRYMLGQPLDFDPGSQYAYSNFGYCVLGQVIEKVSGQAYDAYVKTQILEPIGVDDMRLGQSLLADQAEGEVHYYAREPDNTRSVFPEIWEPVPWPYGGFYLEAMDSHGGWIASASDLARFASALHDGNPLPIVNSESLELMLSRPEIPIWEGSASYYALGWHVRPAWQRATLWHTGTLPGTNAVLYRTSDGLIWAALFNSHADTSGDEFFVDLITEMGQAAFLDEILLCSGIFLTCLIGIIFLIVARRKRRRTREKEYDPYENDPV